MKNLKCLLAYDGTRYFGFQKTKMGPSIEEALQNALETILQHPIQIQGASRTDRGVHAKGQVINFFTSRDPDLNTLYASMRSLLPSDISPLELTWEDETFHPTVDAKSKEYTYLICNSATQLPFHRAFSWHFYYPLDLDIMGRAAKELEGKHDFTAFSNLRYDDPVRHVENITIETLPEGRLEFRIQGTHFLYKMVRNIVGTLAYIGCGEIALADLSPILKSRDRRLAGITAPAHGLYLKRVFY